MLMNNKSLSQKELLFCSYYAVRQNPREAALGAGYRINPEKAGLRLLKNDAVRSKVSALLQKDRASADEIAAGYRRLAFGCIADPAELALCGDISPERLREMDLFSVSEIKVTKGKGVEIKFFDRLKALEKLSNLTKESGKTPDDFFKAIEEGADALKYGCGADE